MEKINKNLLFSLVFLSLVFAISILTAIVILGFNFEIWVSLYSMIPVAVLYFLFSVLFTMYLHEEKFEGNLVITTITITALWITFIVMIFGLGLLLVGNINFVWFIGAAETVGILLAIGGSKL